MKSVISKKYSGPYGSYDPGSVGATMNALSVQENVSTTFIDNLVFDVAGQIRKGQGGPVVANYIWVGGHVFFEWLNDRKESIWAVADHGIHHLCPKLRLAGHEIRFDITKEMLPYENEFDKEACFRQLAQWFHVRPFKISPLTVTIDHEEMSIAVTSKCNDDIDEAVKAFEQFAGFSFQSNEDQRKWVNSFSNRVVEKAEQMFRVFSTTVNIQPNQSYCTELKDLEIRLRVAWLELAWNELYG